MEDHQKASGGYDGKGDPFGTPKFHVKFHLTPNQSDKVRSGTVGVTMVKNNANNSNGLVSSSKSIKSLPANPLIGQKLADGKIQVEKQFGKNRDLYLGTYHLHGNQTRTVFIKSKRQSQQIKWLRHESQMYTILDAFRFRRHVPLWYYHGPCNDQEVLCLEFLGPSLLELWHRCEQQFSILGLAQIGYQLVELMQYLHDCGLVYRNVHPGNFLYGPSGTDRWNKLYAVNLKYCKQWYQENPIPITQMGTTVPGICGTPARFMPMDTHLGGDYSRRDDLESISYLLAYLYKRSLPWMDLETLPAMDMHHQMAQAKASSGSSLFIRMLPEFTRFHHLVRSTKPEERPKYSDMEKLFQDIKTMIGFKNPNQCFDFDENHRIKEL